MKKIDFIQTVVPYGLNKNLGENCNKIMELSEDWVLFHDADVFIATNPNWYEICINAVNTLGYDAGLITCRCNRLGNPDQILRVMESDDINYHHNIAFEIGHAEKGNFIDITDRKGISGFFFITHKKAWLDAGNFQNKFLGMDTRYCGDIKRAGYKVYLMLELYCYHRYRRYWKNG